MEDSTGKSFIMPYRGSVMDRTINRQNGNTTNVPGGGIFSKNNNKIKQMATLNSIFIKKETLELIVNTLNKKGENGISLTISVNDNQDDYDNNVRCFVSQTKEEQESKKAKFYVGNGKTFWSNKNDFIPVKRAKSASTIQNDFLEKELPF